jgi:hypothetical protein
MSWKISRFFGFPHFQKTVLSLLSPWFHGVRRKKVTTSNPPYLHSYEVIKGNFFHIIMQQMCAPLSFHKFTNFHPPEKGTDRGEEGATRCHTNPEKVFRNQGKLLLCLLCCILLVFQRKSAGEECFD